MSATLESRKAGTLFALILCLACLMYAPGVRALNLYAHSENPLVVNDVYPFEGDDQQSYPAISGLRDKEVEKTVNERLKALFYELLAADLPAYRGIRVLARTAGGDAQSYVDMRAEASVDNLLCVSATRYYTFQDPRGGEEIYVSDLRAVTFDLRTGREIVLSDLFRPGADYKGHVGGVLADSILQRGAADEEVSAPADADGDAPRLYAPDFSLIAPFTGIRDDQKFLLRGFGGYLWLDVILDADTPEFETHYTWVPVTVPLCADMDFNERFRTDETLYESDGGGLFLQEFFGGDEPSSQYEEVTFPLGFDQALTCRTRVVTEDGWPEALRKAALGFAGAHSLADEAVARYQSDRAAGGNARFAVDQDVSSYRVGPYVNLWCSARLFRTDNNGEEEDILWNGHRASFRTDTGDVMDAEAIFTDADWQSALADGLLARMRRFTPGERAEIAPGWGDAEADSRWTDAARTLAARVEAFGIGVNGLLLEYADDALDRLPEGVNAQALRDNLGDVSYADIGRARLKVFD